MAVQKWRGPPPRDAGSDPRNVRLLGGCDAHGISQKTREVQARDRRLRDIVRRVHALGPRPLYELIRELDTGADLLGTLECYARLPAEFVRANGGDVLPESSFFAIEGGAR